MRYLIALALVSCADSEPEQIDENIRHVDVAVHQIDAVNPGCTREPTLDCCTLLPDELAVAECAARDVPPGSCGVYVCWRSDCSRTLVNFCAPN